MSTTLTALSKELGDTVEKLRETLVRVEGRQRLPASGWLWSKDGLVVTANHVVRREDGIRVRFDGQEQQAAEIIGRDPQRDLILLKTSLGGVTAKPATLSSEMKVGHLVLALGRPGNAVMATMGVLSSIDSGLHRGGGDGYLQTDVVMYPGFSGGPLVSSDGKVLGMNTSGLARGVSLAVPVGRITTSVTAIIDHGSVRQGYLGVSLQPVRLSAALETELSQSSGLMIVGVEEDSPASHHGLVQGDVIVRYNQEPIRQLDDLFVQLSDEQIGQSARLTVIRAGALSEHDVEIGVRQ
jgi:S1-C subfamily serine protease